MSWDLLHLHRLLWPCKCPTSHRGQHYFSQYPSIKPQHRPKIRFEDVLLAQFCTLPILLTTKILWCTKPSRNDNKARKAAACCCGPLLRLLRTELCITNLADILGCASGTGKNSTRSDKCSLVGGAILEGSFHVDYPARMESWSQVPRLAKNVR